MNEPVKSRSKRPTVTIGMPVYNGENYIREALDSALSQTLDDFELIISDNASSDATQEICLDYVRKDPRIRYIRQPENVGVVKNFKLVAYEASGTYFTWLAHDDRLNPKYLEVMVDYMRRHLEVVLATSDFNEIDSDGNFTKEQRLASIREDIDWNERFFCFFEFSSSNSYLAIYGVMDSEICKKVLRKAPNSKSAVAGETPILCRFAIAGEIVAIPLKLRDNRRHSASYMGTAAAHFRKRGWIRKVLYYMSMSRPAVVQPIGILFTSALPPLVIVTASARIAGKFTSFCFRRVVGHLPLIGRFR